MWTWIGAIGVGMGIFLFFRALTMERSPDLLETRLAQFRDQPLTLDEIELQQPFTERFIRPGMERLGAFLNTRLGRERQQVLQNKLALAGRPGNLTVNGFISIKLVAGVGLGVFMGVFLLGIFAGYKLPIVGGLGIINTIFLGVIFFLIGYYLPDLWLRQKVQARQKEIRLALPNALDLLTIAVEAR